MKKYLTLLLLLPLIVHAGDTTFNLRTYSVTHDTTKTTTIPQRIIHRADSTITLTDTSFKSVYKWRLFKNNHGTTTQIIALYDTIPAHDTTFNCHNCATHDTTVIDTIIIPTPPPSDIIYGVFILNTGTTLSARTSRANTIKGTLPAFAFRYNYDRGDNTYSVQTIKNAGLLVAMTYNNRRVQDVAYFPTGAALTATVHTVDSLLTVSKPDILSIENEEGNQSYHKGTVTDYLAELNAITVVAHAHNVPISNGGTTIGVVYAMRKWFSDRGRADSVTWLNNALGLSPNTSFGQAQIDWYVPLLNGIAASNVDYINFHWYEPPRTDTFPTTTSKVLPVLINYLRTITGKEVITTEAGTRNHSSALLFEMFDEITNGDCKLAVYYDGDGPAAVSNEQAFKAYLLQ